jgi:DNA repair protein RecN (Recombination protein N)
VYKFKKRKIAYFVFLAMLLSISISNFVLIRSLELDLRNGLSIITGETGAGKSILLGALSLLKGARAEAGMVGTQGKKCVIEGCFDLSRFNLEGFFREHDLDFDTKCIVRREIGSDGKSRAFVNDTPVNVSLLKVLGDELVDIHSQHETLLLRNKSFQLSVLDVMASNEKMLYEYKSLFKNVKSLELEIETLRQTESQWQRELDLNRFLFEELEEAEIKPGEIEQLEKEQKILEGAGDILETLASASQFLDGESGAVQKLSGLISSFSKQAALHPGLAEVLERLKSLQIEQKDLARELDHLSESIGTDPEKLEKIRSRLDNLNSLLRKHHCKTTDDLISTRVLIKSKLEGFGNLSDKIRELETRLENDKSSLHSIGKEISSRRKKAIPGLEKKLVSLLESLELKGAQIKISLSSLDAPGAGGMDGIEFLFSANPGNPGSALEKTASGGELSRVMLAIKSVLGTKQGYATLILDEIDTGISGKAADRVGRLLREMAANMQILAITHLPQVAAKGQSHFHIYKEGKDAITETRVRNLNHEERVVEIARLLSSGDPTPVSLSNARELLSN